ncbi:hypothetical protein BDA96_04G269400 [Sorghum bicolor]|uniref:Uncharacterized protein n=2 Tax=Sorghum bicolor TaxID=4558 RepID=A0A921R6J8_SORBI|nr:hypothetical protein BDA96_04G269400 [Sorghum bicolor]OQU85474.1 hypothetical protein SORBI_3004G252700 [Sorghum bicolor]
MEAGDPALPATEEQARVAGPRGACRPRAGARPHFLSRPKRVPPSLFIIWKSVKVGGCFGDGLAKGDGHHSTMQQTNK